MTYFITNLKRRPPEDEVLQEIVDNPEEPIPSGVVLGLSISLSGLYYVFKRNPWGYPIGTWFRRFDDGYERALVEQNDGRMSVIGFEGLVLPHSAIGPYLRKVLKVGFDNGAFRQDRRRKLGD